MMVNDIKVLMSPRCHGKTIKSNKLYNEPLKLMVDKMPFNPGPYSITKVWFDEAENIMKAEEVGLLKEDVNESSE